jgi:hypothetical protein
MLADDVGVDAYARSADDSNYRFPGGTIVRADPARGRPDFLISWRSHSRASTRLKAKVNVDAATVTVMTVVPMMVTMMVVMPVAVVAIVGPVRVRTAVGRIAVATTVATVTAIAATVPAMIGLGRADESARSQNCHRHQREKYLAHDLAPVAPGGKFAGRIPTGTREPIGRNDAKEQGVLLQSIAATAVETGFANGVNARLWSLPSSQ